MTPPASLCCTENDRIMLIREGGTSDLDYVICLNQIGSMLLVEFFSLL